MNSIHTLLSTRRYLFIYAINYKPLKYYIFQKLSIKNGLKSNGKSILAHHYRHRHTINMYHVKLE